VLGVQVKETEWVVAATPVPDNVMESGELVALLATDTLPDTVPAADGENVVVKVVVCPGVRISPEETPEAVNPAPETVTLEIVTVEFPAFVSVTF
jgi:uncharacterized protein (DUF934 family)